MRNPFNTGLIPGLDLGRVFLPPIIGEVIVHDACLWAGGLDLPREARV